MISRILFIVVAAAGCGEVVPTAIDAEPPPDAPPPPPCERADVPLEDFLGCIAEAYCDRIRTCGLFDVGDDVDCSGLNLELDDDLDTREARSALPALVAAGRITYDGVAAKACLDMMPTLACAEVIEGPDLALDCGLFTGPRAASQSCEFDVECATPGSVCRTLDFGNIAPPDCATAQICWDPIATGGICENDRPCRPGDHCVRSNSGNDICRPGDAGAMCGSDTECDVGLRCVGGSSGNPMGTCQPTVGAGMACTDFNDCDAGLDCVTASGTCEVADTVGAPCGILCSGGLVCDQVAGTCVEYTPEGTPCTMDAECLSGVSLFNLMRCDDAGTPADTSDDTCQSPGEVGEACANTSDCDVGLHCTAQLNMMPTGTCAAARADGLACNNDGQCVSGNCAGVECAPVDVCSP